MLKDPPILALAVGQTLVWAGLYYIFPALLLEWEATLGWSKPRLTLAITLAVMASALCAPLAGRLIDRGHAALLLPVSACMGGAALLLLSAVTQLWQFYLVWAVAGVAMSGCLYEACFALVTRARGADARRPIVFITLVAGFASTLSFPSAYMLTGQFGWRAAAAGFGLVVICAAAPLLWVGARGLEGSVRRAPPKPDAPTAGDRTFLRQPSFWFLAAGFAGLALVQGSVLQHLLPILDAFHIAPASAVVAASMIGPMQVAGRLAMTWSGPAFTLRRVMTAAVIGMALSLAALLAVQAEASALVLFVVLFGGAYGAVSVLRPLVARQVLGEENFGVKSGALAMPYLAGFALAPYLGALIWSASGYGAMVGVMAVLAVLAGLLYRQADRGDPR